MRLSRPGLARFSRLAPPRVRPLAVVVVVAVLLVLGGAWLWVRDSSLVAVQRVIVTGASGPDAGQIRRALAGAGRDMTTLDVQKSKLWNAVSPYPMVKDLQVSTSFPHGLRIRVIEQTPVATITAEGRRIAVASDGTLLRDVAPSLSLPTISVRVLPGGTRVTDPQALRAVDVLAAAPDQLLAHVQQASSNAAHGVVVQLRNGPSVYFGDQALLNAKWLAAAGVLADKSSVGASYIDVTDPYRPAAGAPPSAGATSSSMGPATVNPAG